MKRQTPSMKIMKRFSALSAVFAAGLVLTACSSKPNYIACPAISAPPEGANAFMKMDETDEVIDVRLNGVRGLCEAGGGGTTEMVVSVGLKLKRAASEELEAGVAEIEMAAFIIDTEDNVLSSDTIKYKTGFAKGQRIHYPAAEYKADMAEGTRLVISLIPAL